MKSGCASVVGAGGAAPRVAHPATSASVASNAPTYRIRQPNERRGSVHIGQILATLGGSEAFDEPSWHVGLDDDASVGGDVTDHSSHAIQTGDLFAVERFAAVEGDRDAPS